MNKIYCFVNNGNGTSWQGVIAIAEDGYCLANHISSNEGWAKHDIGINSDWKHEDYKEHYPDGYELEWISNEEVLTHVGLEKSFELNKELGKQAELAEDKKAGATITYN